MNIDDTGLGGGVTDRLREVKREQKLNRLYVVPINAAEKIETDTKAGKDAAEHYNNLTTHMWATLKDLMENKEVEIEEDQETFAQLSSRKYFLASNGKLEVENKKEMKSEGSTLRTVRMRWHYPYILEKSRSTPEALRIKKALLVLVRAVTGGTNRR